MRLIIVMLVVPGLKGQTTDFVKVRVLVGLQVVLETLLEETVKRLNSKVATPSFLQMFEWSIPKAPVTRTCTTFCGGEWPARHALDHGPVACMWTIVKRGFLHRSLACGLLVIRLLRTIDDCHGMTLCFCK